MEENGKQTEMPRDRSFESSLDRLEKLAFSLQKEKLPLQEVTARFQEGMELAEHCMELLNRAEESVRSASDTLKNLTGDGRKKENDPIDNGGEESSH